MESRKSKRERRSTIRYVDQGEKRFWHKKGEIIFYEYGNDVGCGHLDPTQQISHAEEERRLITRKIPEIFQPLKDANFRKLNVGTKTLQILGLTIAKFRFD